MEKQEIALRNEKGPIKVEPYEHQTRYYETDLSGMIHQTNYVKWLEDARMDLLEQIGLGPKQMEEMEVICPLLSQSITYTSMVRFDETVVIDVKVLHYDGRQMELAYTIKDKATDELRARAKSTHVFMNQAGTPISMKRIYPELETTSFEFR